MSESRLSKLMSRKKARRALQFGALCYRKRKGKLQFLLVTSRGGNQWIAPKGQLMKKLGPSQTALEEAYEEAGAIGILTGDCIGIVKHHRSAAAPGTNQVAMYPVLVSRTIKRYPENKQRRRKWMGRKKAARSVVSKELAQLILDFKPGKHHKAASR